MSLKSILSFINPVVPMGTVALLVWMAVMSRDIAHIKENLSNHITDTNKKIEKNTDKLEAVQVKLEKNTDDLRGGQEDIKAKLEAMIKENTDKLERELKESQSKIDGKLDKLLDKRSG